MIVLIVKAFTKLLRALIHRGNQDFLQKSLTNISFECILNISWRSRLCAKLKYGFRIKLKKYYKIDKNVRTRDFFKINFSLLIKLKFYFEKGHLLIKVWKISNLILVKKNLLTIKKNSQTKLGTNFN